MPLQASATSSGLPDDKYMTLPSRKIGTPRTERTPAAALEVNNCSGNVSWLKGIAGIGIIRRRKAQGNSRARKSVHPQKRTIKPANESSREKRARNNSAPICPITSMPSANASTSKPDHEGRWGIRRRRPRSCQTTKPENTGTKNPWEKFGSCHHCPTRRERVGAYSHTRRPASTAIKRRTGVEICINGTLFKWGRIAGELKESMEPH